MSHGGGESGRVHEKSEHAKRKSGASGDEFVQAISKIAVAQICESAGFQTFQQSALEILSDITIQYMRNLGKLAQSFANSAGRTKGLEELGSSQGIADASDIDHCIASSGTVTELVKYFSEVEDILFAYSIPFFPVAREWKPVSNFLQVGEGPPVEHIPAWLPAYPDPQTYLQLPMENEGATDCGTHKFENFTGNQSGGLSSFAPVDGIEAKLSVEGNPFLAAPLHFGEKEVSHVVLPAKLSNESALRNHIDQNGLLVNHVSVLNTFAPAIEATKSRLSDSEEGQKKVLLDQRRAVEFKIGVGKKSLGIALELSSQNKGLEKISSWSGKDGEKDDKKKRGLKNSETIYR
uniref:Transcription initiation factor TFIID subunit 8 n=1 Tax=Manihot esculenta TaxID=3983 RepID=A0A2C9WB61_MANES